MIRFTGTFYLNSLHVLGFWWLAWPRTCLRGISSRSNHREGWMKPCLGQCRWRAFEWMEHCLRAKVIVHSWGHCTWRWSAMWGDKRLEQCIRCSVAHNIVLEESKWDTVLPKDERPNALPRQLRMRVIMPVYVDQTLKMMKAIQDSRCITLAQNRTITLFHCHVIKRVERGRHWAGRWKSFYLALSDAMILEGLVKCILVLLFDGPEGIGDGTDFNDFRSEFHSLVKCSAETWQHGSLSVFWVDLLHDLFKIGPSCGSGQGRALTRVGTQAGQKNGTGLSWLSLA